MGMTGTALLRQLQNEHTPNLDLLVRESIQNSLDATTGDRYVIVNFKIGEFDKNKLANHFEGIEEKLRQKFVEDNCKFLAIQDSHTTGLTGKLNKEDVMDDQYGNLIKLVYDIAKPQEQQGAGGSWGLGKTVYFRIGIGLVIYYSRLWNPDTRNYESRLAACYVEDEKGVNPILPLYNNHKKSGIAWWGEMLRENKTVPLTDEEKINDILSIFGITPYSRKLTGTTVIIPFINEAALLNNKQPEYTIGENTLIPYWRRSIEEYLKISVQRWYTPRLCNDYYKYGCKLYVKINGKNVERDNMEPIFQLIQHLYNKAAEAEIREDDYGFGNKYSTCQCQIEEIKVREELDSTKSGIVAFAKISKEDLGMLPPNNHYDPNIYLNTSLPEGGNNAPILTFTRKPGMLVSYVTNGDWLYQVPPTSENEYLIAVYVLNGENTLRNIQGYSLEEYVRNGEEADHTSWSDHDKKLERKPPIVERIKKNTAKKLASQFDDQPSIHQEYMDRGLGQSLADILLPPEGFGHSATTPNAGGSHVTRLGNGVKLRYSLVNTKYHADGMEVSFEILAKKKVDKFKFGISIASESKPIDCDSWEKEFDMKLPFKLTSANLKFKKLDGGENLQEYEIGQESNSLLFRYLTTTQDKIPYGVSVDFESAHSFELVLTLSLSVSSKDVKPIFKPLN